MSRIKTRLDKLETTAANNDRPPFTGLQVFTGKEYDAWLETKEGKQYLEQEAVKPKRGETPAFTGFIMVLGDIERQPPIGLR